MLNESIMLFSSTLGKRLEPVSIVCYTILICPLLDTLSHSVGDRTVESGAIVDNVYKFLVDITWQILVHLGTVENILSVIL